MDSNSPVHDRRHFLRQGGIITFATITGISLLHSCNTDKDSDEGQEVSPPEDLMQEHGLLNRILLIYDTCRTRLSANQVIPMAALGNAAGIIRSFVEDYHEKQEEQYLFPRFQKANQLTDLVQVLLAQHNAGRRITDQLIQLTSTGTQTDTQRIISLLTSFNTMYRPHEAREDTVLFPAFRKIVSKHEYDSLGEEFEKNEEKKFGKGGFETMVDKVAGIEKQLGIYDLALFTPSV